MNISGILQGFSAYLESLNESSDKAYNTDNSSISVFMYSSKFKSYITEELNIADPTIFSKSINEILGMDFVDGKLVENTDNNSDSYEFSGDEEQDTETNTDIICNGSEAANSVQGEKTDVQINPENVLIEILNNLFEDTSFMTALDEDKSGDVDKEEISSFLSSINETDGDINNLSLEDIIAGIEQIKEIIETSATREGNGLKFDSQEEDYDVETRQNPISSGRSSSSPLGNVVRNIVNRIFNPSQSKSEIIQEKTLDNMTKDELNAELITSDFELTQKNNYLSSLYDGSESNIQAMNQNIENLYNSYLKNLETIDKDMAEQVDTLQKDIDTKEQEIKSKEQEIANQENIVSESETAYKNAVSHTQQLKSSLSALQATDTSNMDDAQISELNSKIAELQSKITEAEQAELEAKKTWDDSKTKLDELNQQRDSLQTELDNLNTQMTELETQINELYPSVQESLNKYKQAKEELENYKSEAISNAKSEVTAAQAYVNEVKTAINNLNNKDIKKEYSLDQKNLYNAEAGSRLAEAASTTRGTTGYCLGGVNDSLEEVYGQRLSFESAYMSAEALRGNIEGYEELANHFVEVEVSRDELADLPAGAIVVWDNNTNGGGSNVSASGKIHGHISIALGNGNESSDHIQAQTVNRDAEYTVFYPIS